ncbi:Hypothetical predicted protein [Marmota monax]|uniref:Uncharacterized protein n=1 Tax=Marmota monax TaxID=9995 RepID=A0A5E4A180_MARMO|nr:hypothetical protein GHT09_001048 [Marmota monax]VTJ51003.1 Hypothetical predicted protein [Marmota monax]
MSLLGSGWLVQQAHQTHTPHWENLLKALCHSPRPRPFPHPRARRLRQVGSPSPALVKPVNLDSTRRRPLLLRAKSAFSNAGVPWGTVPTGDLLAGLFPSKDIDKGTWIQVLPAVPVLSSWQQWLCDGNYLGGARL